MNSDFQQYATRTAFNITLTKVQIRCLCSLHQGFVCTEDVRNWFATEGSLKNKGLIEQVPIETESFPYKTKVVTLERRLTRAGRIMILMLKESGLYVEYEEAEVEGWGKRVDAA